MTRACSIQNCAKRREAGSNISLHIFPSNSIMRDRWIEAMRCENFQPTQYTRICSKHFTPDCYVSKSPGSKKLLKKDAVPSIFDFPIHVIKGTTPRKLSESRLQPQNIEVQNENEPDKHTVTTNDKIFTEPLVNKKKASYVGNFKKRSYSTKDNRYKFMMNWVLTMKQKQIRKLQQHNRQLLKKVSNLNNSLKNLKRQQMINNNRSSELHGTIPVTRNTSETDEFDDGTLDSINFSSDSEENSFENFVPLKEKSTNCIDEKKDNIEMKNNFQVENENDILEQNKIHDDEHEDTKRYLAQLMIIKQKWEAIKLKKDLLQKELDNSYIGDNIEKLSRILGEKENNLEEFQDYLKQKDIVIAQLKDQDIISLYENRNITSTHNKLPDLIDENPLDSLDDDNFFDCDYCPQIFSTRGTLEVHLKSHDYKIFDFCEDCGSEFANNKAKQTHDITCKKKLLCRYCNIMLYTKERKQQHEQYHCDIIFGQICDICGNRFKSQGTLNQHISTRHTSWKTVLKCPKCPEIFASKQKLTNHVKLVHTSSQTYLCEKCGDDFNSLASLRHHRIGNHKSTNNEHESPVCHKLLPSYNSSYTMQCPYCDKMFEKESTLKRHIILHEDHQRQYLCDTCGVSFNHPYKFRLHMNIHGKSDSALEECSCPICPKKFPNYSMLVLHQDSVHKDDKQYTCHICNKPMLSIKSLKWHMSYTHNETPTGIALDNSKNSVKLKRLSCNHCDKTFKTAKILRAHIKKTHSESNLVKCLECDLRFMSEVRLRHHMMIVHDQLEDTIKYMCDICDTNLKTKIRLIKHHQDQHSDERPLQCRYCEWRCKQISALVYHERIHTNELPYSCIVCEQRFKYFNDKQKHEEKHESLDGAGFEMIVADGNIENSKNQDEEVSASENDLLEQKYQAIDDNLTDQHDEYDSQYNGKQIIEFEEQEINNENQHHIQELDQEYMQDIQQEIDEEVDNKTENEYIDEIGLYDEEENLEHQQWQYERETDTNNDYKQEYKHEYELLPGETFEASEVIMNMEDETVYTEEVTTDNIENAEMTAKQTVPTETVVHMQQQNHNKKIQMIPLMSSLNELIRLQK